MLAAAVFWGSWYLVVGSLPETKEILLFEDAAWSLPLVFSRWWDLLFAPLMMTFFFWVWRRHSKLGNDDQPTFDIGLSLGFILNVLFVVFYGFHYSLAFCLLFVLGVGFLGGLMMTLCGTMHTGFIFGLSYCFVFGSFGFGCNFGFIFAPLGAILSFWACLCVIPFGLFLKWLYFKRVRGRPLFAWDW
jgi:hypothetical protein